ncbi:Uncharacterised protein r2_g1221 [Pycnogonum litorale]
MYNTGMGGVDVCDRLLASYSSKKWWWNLFSHIINLSVVAAFEFYCKVNNTNVNHLQFRRQIVRTLVKNEKARYRLGGPTAQPSYGVRFDGVNHFLKSTTQGRCVVCKMNRRLSCIKCTKRHHKACSDTYHRKQIPGFKCVY